MQLCLEWRRESWKDGWKDGGKGQNCGYFRGWTKDMDDAICTSEQPFICRVSQSKYQETTSTRLVYRQDDINFTSIHIGWKYKFANQTIINAIKSQTMSGFRLKWQIKDIYGNAVNTAVDPSYNNTRDLLNMRKTVNLVKQARESGTTTEEVKEAMQKMKISMVEESILTSSQTKSINECIKNPMMRCNCAEGRVFSSHYKGRLLRKAMQTLNINMVVEDTVTEDDINIGLRIYTELSFCPFHFAELLLFHMELSRHQSPGTVFQALMNNLQNVTDPGSLRQMKHYFVKLDEIFKLTLGSSLSSISSISTMEDFQKQDAPFFIRDQPNFTDTTGMTF